MFTSYFITERSFVLTLATSSSMSYIIPQYGMCRVRVQKGKDYFNFFMAMIDFIESETTDAVVQQIPARLAQCPYS